MSKVKAGQLLAKRGLLQEDLEAIRTLADSCQKHDHVTLKLNYDMLMCRPADEFNDFLYYAGESLIGFLGLYQFNQQEIELSGMVHPDYRRTGIFTSLVSTAEEEIRRRGIHNLIFINAHGSDTGQSYLQSLGAEYSFSEHWMKATEPKPADITAPIVLRPATSTDITSVAHLTAICFDKDEADTQVSLAKSWQLSEAKQRYVIELQGETIGTLAIDWTDEDGAFIYGFCITPDKQGQGYGRQALSLALQVAVQNHRAFVELEVACENAHALSLYESCGFQVVRANDYYVKGLRP